MISIVCLLRAFFENSGKSRNIVVISYIRQPTGVQKSKICENTILKEKKI